jgi:hypothetical protein
MAVPMRDSTAMMVSSSDAASAFRSSAARLTGPTTPDESTRAALTWEPPISIAGLATAYPASVPSGRG